MSLAPLYLCLCPEQKHYTSAGIRVTDVHPLVGQLSREAGIEMSGGLLSVLAPALSVEPSPGVFPTLTGRGPMTAFALYPFSRRTNMFKTM